MNIVYIGPERGTSLHRARALNRLGHNINIIDPWSWLGNSKWISRWLFRLGGWGSEIFIDKKLAYQTSAFSPDLIWVDQGPFLGPSCLKRLKKLRVPIVNLTVDDPFSAKNAKMRFYKYRRAIKFYNLVVVVRNENVSEAYRKGAIDVKQVWRSADEIAHAPRILTSDEKQRFASEVSFIGTWMPERGPFMVELIERGVPLSIWGDNWPKSPQWPLIKSYWRGPGLYTDQAYSAAILGAKICLGLLSKGNRDLHTQRSLEIPSLGRLLCAKRTSEHLELYEDSVEAVFWNDATECAFLCKNLLDNDKLREQIARNGRERALQNNCFNEPVMASIIERAMAQSR